ncbi:probable inactive heme oxygenase 2, chloroplastic [Quercus suber]|uniref:probable inactive heme oxygenase 2, chloroplastic n=1 Tax=Quercus suber TaxID=58331 RepID=UPI000CE24885|nr:probable inactive heme oxygenase 2, chloroplastic [Quercus suber]XP_023923360.1 probable inactive heme oxygenase 2, chloroplastic [Quercus suber]
MMSLLKTTVQQPLLLQQLQLQQHSMPMHSSSFISTNTTNQKKKSMSNRRALILCCSGSNTSSYSPSPSISTTTSAPPIIKRRKRYRRQYPGESIGITEEMRFVAMRLRNVKGKKYTKDSLGEDEEEDENLASDNDGDDGGVTWQPSMEGFLNYLVDSKLVFNTVERIVDESSHVAYAYFRKTGLERSEALEKDLEWLRQQGFVIPEPSSPGISYAKYLGELSEKSAPLFMCHFYNIYFSHIAGGQVIARQVSEMLLEGRELEFYKWEGNVAELIKDVREKLNMLGEHWCRDEKNRCLKEATKAFRFLGQIVRLIIL